MSLRIDLSRPSLILAAIAVGVDAAIVFAYANGILIGEAAAVLVAVVSAVAAVLVPKPSA